MGPKKVANRMGGLEECKQYCPKIMKGTVFWGKITTVDLY